MLDIDGNPIIVGGGSGGDSGGGLFGLIFELLRAIITLPGQLLGVVTQLGGIVNSILDLFGNLAEFVFVLLTNLIVPSDGFFENSFSGVKDSLDARIPVIGQVIDLSGEITNVMRSSTGTQLPNEPITPDSVTPMGIETTSETHRPRFEFTLPDELGGGTYQLIDLTWFDQYRGFVHALIIAFSVFMLARKVLRKLPRIMYK
jgi:hypothetical protein